MDAVYTVGYCFLLGGGELLAFYLHRSGAKSGAKVLAVSSPVLAAVGIVGSFLGAGGILYDSVWLTFGLALFGMVYVEFKKPTVLILLGIPFYVLALSILASLPFLILFAVLAFELGVLDAYRLSTYDIAAVHQAEAERRELRTITAPFRGMLRLVGSFFHGQPSQGTTFFLYALVPVALTSLVFVAWLLAGPAEIAYAMVIMIGFYFALVSLRL